MIARFIFCEKDKHVVVTLFSPTGILLKQQFYFLLAPTINDKGTWSDKDPF